MSTRRRSIEQIVEEQVQRWDYTHREPKIGKMPRHMITLSREPGSGGDLVARGISEHLNLDLFHQKVIHEMARSAKVSHQLVQSLDEKALNVLEDSIASVILRRHLWPDEYLKHLLRVISTIGNHGNAVIIGRGANFILPRKNIFRIRVIAAPQFRAQKVAETFDISLDEAKRRILKTESDRKAFVRKYFHEDIADPANYDVVLNTGSISITEAIACCCSILNLRNQN
jgi:cytidylate kinase